MPTAAGAKWAADTSMVSTKVAFWVHECENLGTKATLVETRRHKGRGWPVRRGQKVQPSVQSVQLLVHGVQRHNQDEQQDGGSDKVGDERAEPHGASWEVGRGPDALLLLLLLLLLIVGMLLLIVGMLQLSNFSS